MSLQPWQRANILAAANYLREQSTSGPASARTGAIHQGLLDVLDPARRVARLQREMAKAVKAAATMGQERRDARERRQKDRRQVNLGGPQGERRAGQERRSGADRRGPRSA